MAPAAAATANSSGIVPGSPAQIRVVSPTLRTETGSKSGRTEEETRPATPETSDQSGSWTESEGAETDQVTTGSKNLATIDLLELSSLKESFLWRPVKFVKNEAYPKVVPEGFYFKQDSGGFALKKQSTGKWYGHFTKKTVKELERKYAQKKPRTKTGGSTGLAPGGDRGSVNR
jgi:hypothetical protein